MKNLRKNVEKKYMKNFESKNSAYNLLLLNMLRELNFLRSIIKFLTISEFVN
jgi:hypothetical protein